MARTITEARLGSPTARSRLKPGRQAHWNTLAAARDHLGWQRWPDEKAGRWLLRRRRGGSYSQQIIGAADDATTADGESVLSYDQARAKAVKLASAGARPIGRITVNAAVADYVDHLASEGKSIRDAENAATTYILPALGKLEVESLTSKQLRDWHAAVASSPARKRGGLRAPPRDDESVRRRRVTANRVLTVLKAALNLAFDESRVPSNIAWGRRVKKFENVDEARLRYLTTDEAVRLINACDPDFRLLVRAALETGMRYGELARLEVADFNPDALTVFVRKSKSHKPRHVVLTAEGGEFFCQACADRSGGQLLLTKASGEPWRTSNQARLIARACRNARIEPPITFHGLRHTWASLAVMNGVPLMVVARNLGHKDTRMAEKHYAHLAASYVADAIRAGAPRFHSPSAVVNFKVNRVK